MNSSFLQFGHLHISIFSFFAALGLMCTLALSQRTARYAHLAAEAVWNAGMTGILSAFVISRLLLIAFNFHSFLHYPLLLLALPSLTTTGLLLTALYMLVYIHWRKLPLFSLLDAATPCAALLWAFLNLGYYFAGTRDGMPTHFGPVTNSLMTPRTQPVEIYAALIGFFVAFRIWTLLRKVSAKPHVPAGTATGIGLVVSGAFIYVLDFFRLPADLFSNFPLDPSQIMGLAMILLGAPLLLRAAARVNPESGTEPPHAI